jgi:hypothetical protein
VDRAGDLGFIQREVLEGTFGVSRKEAAAVFALDERSDKRYHARARKDITFFKWAKKDWGCPLSLFNKTMDKKGHQPTDQLLLSYVGRQGYGYPFGPFEGYRVSVRHTSRYLRVCRGHGHTSEKKWKIIKRAEDQVIEITEQYTEGLITGGEKV